MIPARRYVLPVAATVPWLLDGNVVALVLTVPLIALGILLFGRAEDIAAGRPVRLLPWPRRRPAHRLG